MMAGRRRDRRRASSAVQRHLHAQRGRYRGLVLACATRTRTSPRPPSSGRSGNTSPRSPSPRATCPWGSQRREVRLWGKPSSKPRSGRWSSTGRAMTTPSPAAATRCSPGLRPVPLVPGEVVDVEFEYTTRSGRNNPRRRDHQQDRRLRQRVRPLHRHRADRHHPHRPCPPFPLWNWTGNFARVGTAGTPAASSRFMRLGSVPIVSFPSSVVVGVTNYQLGTHYHLLRGPPSTPERCGDRRDRVAGLRTGYLHCTDPELRVQTGCPKPWA